MADYIDRQAAIAALREFAEECKGSDEAATAAAMAISVISRMPGPWVSVEEQKPAEEDNVVILVRSIEHYGKHKELRAIYRDVYAGYLIDDDWCTYYCHGYKNVREEAERFADEEYAVTHWMPLPDAPEVKS